MSGVKKINILGGGWITAAGFGTLNGNNKFNLVAGDLIIPKAKEIFSKPLSRYGRFDQYTKLGCAAIALALKDAELDESEDKRQIGVIVSSAYECFESDLAYYETSLDGDGFFSSPNLFSYTLPGIVIGEAAIHFKMTGPTFILGDLPGQKGYTALTTAVDLINSGACDTVVAGWLDAPNERLSKLESHDDGRRGAIFFVLSKRQKNKKEIGLHVENGAIFLSSGKEVHSVLDLIA